MRCTVCAHPERKAIDAALLQGAPFRDLARRTSTGKDALVRHRDRHLPAMLVKVKAQEAAEIASAESVTAKILAIETEAKRLGHRAEETGDLRAALMALRELTRLVELGARLSGELRGERVAVNVNLSPEAAQKMAEVYLSRRGHLIETEAR